MTESKNTYLPEQGEIDRTKIKGYSLLIGAFTSWVKENGYTTSQIAARLNMKEEDLLSKLKEKQLFNREQLRILIQDAVIWHITTYERPIKQNDCIRGMDDCYLMFKNGIITEVARHHSGYVPITDYTEMQPKHCPKCGTKLKY